MQKLNILGLLALTSLLIGACSGGGALVPGGSAPGGSAPGGTEPSANDLEGRTFLSTGIEGRTIAAGTRIRLTFQNGNIGASAGCNSMGGPFRIEGGLLRTPQMITTEMGCQPELMAQDQWIADLLNESMLVLDGDVLTLSKGDVSLSLLDRRVADPDRPLIGTQWVVDGILDGDTASSVPAAAIASVTLSAGRADVETGCNSGSADADISANTIEFGPLVLTKRACPPETMGLEQAVVRVVHGLIQYRIEADVLTMTSGGFGLMLRATP